MDGAVRQQEPLERLRVVEVDRRLGQRLQSRQLIALDPPRGRLGRRRLEQQPQLVDLEHVAHRQRRDHVAATRLGDHEPLRAQPRQRRPHRRLGEAEPLDQLRLGDRRPGRQLEPHDRVPQPLVGRHSGIRALHETTPYASDMTQTAL